jgi:phosphate starvation-inducible protein PhoH and related proteins
LLEHTITLEGISLLEFLGAENRNLKQLSAYFPSTKILSRGNEIKIKGNSEEVVKISEIIDQIIAHYNKYGAINSDVIKGYAKNFNYANPDTSDDSVILFGNFGNAIKAKTPNQQVLVNTIRKKDIVFALGPAGCGKTFLAVAMAVLALKNKEIKKIIITRPVVEAGENLGFLPGDLKDKIDPYLRPIYDSLDDMLPVEKLKYYFENRMIEIAPLAYMRGRTLNNAYVILDEAQNTTAMQIKMFLTRMGPSSKVIVTGDISQIDLPTKTKSGLIEAINILKGIDEIGFVTLDTSDIVRHRLVKDIIKAYDKYESKKTN